MNNHEVLCGKLNVIGQDKKWLNKSDTGQICWDNNYLLVPRLDIQPFLTYFTYKKKHKVPIKKIEEYFLEFIVVNYKLKGIVEVRFYNCKGNTFQMENNVYENTERAKALSETVWLINYDTNKFYYVPTEYLDLLGDSRNYVNFNDFELYLNKN